MMLCAEVRMPRKNVLDWGDLFRQFGVMIVGAIVVLMGFYFTTNSTLQRHDGQFVEIAKKFDGFNTTLQKNYEDWARQNKADQEKADRVREQFLQTFNTMGQSSAALKVQVDNTSKQLDAVINKLDMIQDVQRRNVPRNNEIR